MTTLDDAGASGPEISTIAARFEEAAYPYPEKLAKKKYAKQLELLQIELLKVQRWAKAEGERIVVLCEGRDAAGKGGTIKRFMEHLNPRGARVVALQKPSEVERGQWYFQRYLAHLPTAGEIVFFDRSWYNRAGVEPVMGFCTPSEHLEFLREAPELERMLVRSGIRLFKYWFSVTRAEQARRFEARRSAPLKQWKLSDIDLAAAEKWDDYTRAMETMFFHTATADAPWTVVRTDDKKRGRLECMKHFLGSLDYAGRDRAVVTKPDPRIVAQSAGEGDVGEQEGAVRKSPAPNTKV